VPDPARPVLSCHAEPPEEEQVEEVVSSASYGVLYVAVDDQDDLEEEGFGPEPY
jgi:hypothetical protein